MVTGNCTQDLVVVVVWFVGDEVSLGSPSCPEECFVEQAGLRVRDLPP